jgi:voltage-gated potassium channel
MAASSQAATTDAGRGGTFGGRYRAFINLHEIAWELAFAALAVTFVTLAFVPVDAGSRVESLVELAEWVITGMFVLEFGSRLFVAPDRGGYLRGHWVDLIGLVPPARWLRPFRLLRLLRLVRAFAGVGRALVHVDRLARHRGLIWLLIAWLAVTMVCSIGLYIAEKGANAAVDSPLDALWWGITTMTTVGYGDVYPVTPEGRLAAAVLMVLGIGLFSAVTATVTSFLIGGRDSSSALAVDLERVAALHSGGQLSDEEFAVAKAKLLG